MTGKLGKLIRLLSSDQPGEVFAAANAITRELRAAGKDIHAFADAAERGLQTAAPGTGSDRQPWRERREWCAERHEVLSVREREFILSLARWRGQLTAKQADWLAGIEEKIRARQAR